jgi:hypothetical protein
MLFAIAQLFPLFAADSEYTRRSLVGLTSLEVVVEDLSSGAARIGLTKEVIQTDVELKIRLAGMRVTSEVPEYLYIATTVTDDGIVACIDIELHQPVTLARAPILITGSTWSEGSVTRNYTAQRIRDVIKDNVDKFLNAWLSVNPKK